jgi:hypothetical protein
VIYNHGEPRWNDFNTGKLLIRPPNIWQSYQHSNLVAKQEKLAKEMMNLAYEILFHMPVRYFADRFGEVRQNLAEEKVPEGRVKAVMQAGLQPM